MKTAQQANERLEKEKLELEKRLKEVSEEAETNEKAWEYSQAQKQYEVGRLQDLVTHASKQNQQLRWNEETQAREIQKWTEQAMSFKQEAERLAHIQNASVKQRDALRQEAHRVFAEAEASAVQYEAEAQRLREQLATVMLAGQAIEEKQGAQQSAARI